MQISDISSMITHAITQTSWRDLLEIGLISSGVYYFLKWLHQDAQKQLVLYCYGYCALTFATHYLKLTIVSQSLILLMPVVVCVFILLHQQTLQKNFVALKPLKPAIATDDHWIDELLRASLYAMNKSKSFVWLIERTDALEATIQAPFVFYSDLKKDLIDLLIDTQTAHETVLWVQQTGKLVAINAQWKTEEPATWLAPQAAQLPAWQQHALLVSSKTDAVIVHSCPLTRLFTIVTQEKSIDAVSAHQTSLLLKRIFIHKALLSEGISYAAQPSQSAPEQRHT